MYVYDKTKREARKRVKGDQENMDETMDSKTGRKVDKCTIYIDSM